MGLMASIGFFYVCHVNMQLSSFVIDENLIVDI